jgi:hypothetical protein
METAEYILVGEQIKNNGFHMNWPMGDHSWVSDNALAYVMGFFYDQWCEVRHSQLVELLTTTVLNILFMFYFIFSLFQFA